MTKGIADQVRKEMTRLCSSELRRGKGQGSFTVQDLANADFEHYVSKDQVRNVIRDFLRSGEIVRTATATYEYTGKRERAANTVRQRVYRAMHTRRMFTSRDIKLLTDADRSYVAMIIRELLRAGELEKVGMKARCAVFLVKDRDGFYTKRCRV